MRTLKAPSPDPILFDWADLPWWIEHLSPSALRTLQTGWQGVFHQTILELLREAAEDLGQKFHESLGRPTKELYAVCGLLLIMEFRHWTIDEAAQAWALDAGVQFALHLGRDRQYLSPRTLDNYRRKLRDQVKLQEIFVKVTEALVQKLELDVRRQRLDSTHVLSHMARLSRVQLLAVGVRRFLRAVAKHDARSYEALPAELRARYTAAETRLFGLGTRAPQPKGQALPQVAEDLAFLATHFAETPHAARASYQAMARLFQEHCTVQLGQVSVRPQSQDAQGGSARCLQNPSDPAAGYSGHKGAGHQVQIAQTLPPRDAEGRREGPGLITACVPQSAAVRDHEALAEVLAQQRSAGLTPTELLADTTYGSDANVQACAALGIHLVSPVGGVAPKAGSVHYCSRAERALKERLAARRAAQETPEWQALYRLRSGLEGVHRALDAVTSMKKLRVRGARAVEIAVTFKVLGWNIRATAQILARRARATAKTKPTGPQPGLTMPLLASHQAHHRRRWLTQNLRAHFGPRLPSRRTGPQLLALER